MSDLRKIPVNHLPSLTWSRLGVNRAEAEIESWAAEDNKTGKNGGSPEEADTQTKGQPYSTGTGYGAEVVSVPSGVEIRIISAGEAQAAVSRISLPLETYVAGKQPIYGSGRFPSGLGAEFQDEMKDCPALFVKIPEGSVSGEPVVIDIGRDTPGGDRARVIILAGNGSQASVVLTSRSGKAGQELLETDVILETDARLEVNCVNLLPESCTLLDDTGVYAAENTEFHYRRLELGAGKSFPGLYVYAAGDGCRVKADTAYLKLGGQTLDMNYVVLQSGRKTESRINVNGVLGGHAEKTFRGTIDFRKGSSGSDGDEREDVLLLDDTVINKTVPVILCEEEDVDGRHGATIGQADEEALYYFASRGIDAQTARELLVRSRILRLSEQIPDKKLYEEISDRVQELLGGDRPARRG